MSLLALMDMPKRTIRSGSCTPGCGACCEWLTMEVNPIYMQNRDIRHWVQLHGITLTEKDGRVWAKLPIPCTALQADKSCGLYGYGEGRPDLCDKWPQVPEDLIELGAPCGYQFTEKEGE